MDLITLYAGFNDTGWPVRIGLLGRVALWLQVHSINYLLLRDILGGILDQFEVNVFDAIAPQRLLSHEQLANRYPKKHFFYCSPYEKPGHTSYTHQTTYHSS